jgi:hypothetical protein
LAATLTRVRTSRVPSAFMTTAAQLPSSAGQATVCGSVPLDTSAQKL